MKKAILILGNKAIAELRSKCDTMNTKYGGEEWQQGEGIVLGLMHQGLSDNVIRAIIPVGGSRIMRLRKILDRDDLPSEEREQLLLEKTMHLSAAIDQRRAMSTFGKQYIAAHVPKQAIPT
ncbi:hypothetical protein AXG93_1822s1020 [Marchantia polymorpha subsp. ruderalis]|uniref:Uncharacterized protein n=1 Tax=Marchantia polymorpha subsp. ruderalis TaxID=1480154 RepID=A0A176W7Y1_MARPO|nr:hypothetical protein AXG93_1822s1020 [Marchantia polymorpha subsp. ruderalis]